MQNIDMTTSMIKEIITGGYGSMVTERLEEGWEGYLLTLMFNRVRGKRESAIRQMWKEAERVYAKVLTRNVRHPRKMPISQLPLWIVVPDFPVPRHTKMGLGEVTVNDGLHLHVLALTPPWSRLNRGLDDHFELSQKLYVRPGLPLRRVHCVPIATNARYVVGYAMKGVKRRRLDFDHVLILPRSHSEMPARDQPSRARTA